VPTFPIVASANGRYFQDSAGVPFLLIADSPQSMAANLSVADATAYLQTRAAQGFNAVQFDIVSTSYNNNNNANHGTFDGITPFLSGTDVTTPNSAYFNRIDQFVNICAQNGLLAILNPYETGAGIDDLVTNGATNCGTYGNFLGNRYKSFTNVMWQLGNDFDVTTQTRFDVVHAMAAGILANDPNHLMSIQLMFLESTAFDATGFGTYGNGFMNCNGAYTYGPTYGYSLVSYNGSGTSFGGTAGTNTSHPCPTFLLEANYEYEHNPNTDGGSNQNLRKQAWWSILGGCSGQIYGNGYVWGFFTAGAATITGGVGFPTGSYVNNLNSPGVAQTMVCVNFFKSIPWYNLVPDQTHVVGTSGFGTAANTGLFTTNDYVTVGATPDGRCAVAYFPQGSANTLTVNMAKFSKPVHGTWIDPASGARTIISGSPFTNSGTRNFTPPAANSAGDPDFGLLLTPLEIVGGPVSRYLGWYA
jgi:hypothetical protein